ncbi:MAG: YgaP family membrane protein [Moraxella sp.]|jgi:hypothetical protein
MKANLGKIDRILRFVLGAVLVGLAAAKIIGIWGFLGIILLATAFMNFCPIYRLLGISTKK